MPRIACSIRAISRRAGSEGPEAAGASAQFPRIVRARSISLQVRTTVTISNGLALSRELPAQACGAPLHERSAVGATEPSEMTAFDLSALERDEFFNTRVSGYRAWAEAVRKLIPTPRGAARFDMTRMVLDAGAATADEAVDHLLGRFLRVPVSAAMRDGLVEFLEDELGTSDLDRARTFLEDPLRMVTHLIMSTPEYQID